MQALDAKICYARAVVSADDSWQVAYELVNGEKTGRWRLLNESGEYDKWWPGHWFPKDKPFTK